MIDVVENITKFQEVAAGNAHPSELKPLLPDEPNDDPNWIAMAVNQIVTQRLQAAAANQYKFRLKMVTMVQEGEEDFETEVTDLDGSKRKVNAKRPKMVEQVERSDWFPEDSQFSAPMMVSQFRRKFPQAAISVERS